MAINIPKAVTGAASSRFVSLTIFLQGPWGAWITDLPIWHNQVSSAHFGIALDGELDTWLGDAYNEEIITDWKWVQDAQDRKLTYADLLLLKVLIDERRRKKA